MTKIQTAIGRMLKAIGFPVWTGGTTDILPGGWGRIEYGGNDQGVLALSAVYGCCRVLCQTLGSLPWHVYRTDTKGARHIDEEHPLYPILHISPNAYMDSMQFREALILDLCLTGNAYAEKMFLANRIVGLNPLRSDWMLPLMQGGGYPIADPGLFYRYQPPNGQYRDYKPEEIIHLKNFARGGIIGVSPIRAHAMTHGMYTDSYATNFMKNQGRPSGVIETDKAKTAKDVDYDEKFRADWQKMYSGEGAGSTAILWNGMKYHQISIAPNDAQYIETKKLNAGEIAGAIYGVPLNKIGLSDKTATYASAEQFAIDFRLDTVAPMAERIQQAFNKSLFATQPGVFCALDLDALMSGDKKTQADYYRSLTDGGILTRNEARKNLNYPERPEADLLTVRSYEVDLNQLPALSVAANAGLSQNDIRKEMPAINVTVAPPISDQQLERLIKGVVKGINAGTGAKNRKIRFIRDKNQKLITSEIVDTPMTDAQISKATREIATATAREFLQLEGAPMKRTVKWETDEDGTMLGAEVTEE